MKNRNIFHYEIFPVQQFNPVAEFSRKDFAAFRVSFCPSSLLLLWARSHSAFLRNPLFGCWVQFRGVRPPLKTFPRGRVNPLRMKITEKWFSRSPAYHRSRDMRCRTEIDLFRHFSNPRASPNKRDPNVSFQTLSWDFDSKSYPLRRVEEYPAGNIGEPQHSHPLEERVIISRGKV